MKMKIKTLLLSAIALATIGGTAFADEFSVAGTTQGGFNPAAPSATQTNQGLTFNAGSFSGTTQNNFLPIGGTTNNFGTFTLVFPPTSNFVNTAFTLQVNFTLPVGAGSGSFSAMISGMVVATTNGVFVNFNNTPLLFTSPTHNFTLAINDLSVNAGDGPIQISGQIVGIERVPEGGATVALLGMSLVGFAAVRRKLGSR